MDFITSFPEDVGYNGVFACMDKLTELTKVFLYYGGEGALSAPTTAKLFFENKVHLYGIPQVVLYSRDPHFTISFRRLYLRSLIIEFCSLLHTIYRLMDKWNKHTRQLSSCNVLMPLSRTQNG